MQLRPAASRLARREAIEFYLFISPWLAGFVIFALGPTLASFAFSFTDWTIIAPPVWAGLGNYVAMLTADPDFWRSLKVTAVYAVGAIPLHLATALFVAMLLNQRVRGESLFRTIYY